MYECNKCLHTGRRVSQHNYYNLHPETSNVNINTSQKYNCGRTKFLTAYLLKTAATLYTTHTFLYNYILLTHKIKIFALLCRKGKFILLVLILTK